MAAVTMTDPEFNPFGAVKSFIETSKEFKSFDFFLPFVFLFLLFYFGLSATSLFGKKSKLRALFALILTLIPLSSESFIQWFSDLVRFFGGSVALLALIGFLLLILSRNSHSSGKHRKGGKGGSDANGGNKK